MSETRTPIADALAKVDALPGNAGELTVTKDALSGEVSTSLGKGWSLGAWASWAYDGAWAVAGKLRWQSKPK